LYGKNSFRVHLIRIVKPFGGVRGVECVRITRHKVHIICTQKVFLAYKWHKKYNLCCTFMRWGCVFQPLRCLLQMPTKYHRDFKILYVLSVSIHPKHPSNLAICSEHFSNHIATPWQPLRHLFRVLLFLHFGLVLQANRNNTLQF